MTASTIDKETLQSAAPSTSEQRKFFLAALIYSILLLLVVALAAYLLWDRLTEFLCVAAFIGGFSDRFSIDLITKFVGSAKHK